MARDRTEYFKEYYRKNAERCKKAQRDRYAANPAASKKRWRNWVDNNREVFRVKCREYKKQRRKTDKQFALRLAVRERIKRYMKQHRAQGSVTSALGCSWSELMRHLESKFQPGMSWENRADWHIDHIRPLSSFDLTDPAQFAQAAHYTNLQPLWALDNLRKSNKW